MFEISEIVEGSYILIDNVEYQVLGKTFYVTEKDAGSIYAKILLNDHNVLVVSPADEIAYFGKNEGRIQEFDGYPKVVIFNGLEYELVNHDYQIVTYIEFGSPLEVEGEVEYWDYEKDNMIISVAVTSRRKIRADVVARYLNFNQISVKKRIGK